MTKACIFLWCLLIALSCSDRPRDPGAGASAATVHVAALTVGEVSRVEIQVSGPGISTPLVFELARQAEGYSGTLTGIPSGPDRTFRGRGFGVGTQLLFEGAATSVTIPNQGTITVQLLLQQVEAEHFDNSAPRFMSLVATGENPIAPGGSLVLTATAKDPDPGDVLRYAWTASAGTFAGTEAPRALWTAPETAGEQTITITVTDSKQATATASLVVRVGSVSNSVAVTTAFNLWPTVSQIVASRSQLDAGQSVELSVTASDQDGDPLTYAWSSSCEGSFANSSAPIAQFTLTALPSPLTECELRVQIDDGRGGSGDGRLRIASGADPIFDPRGPLPRPRFEAPIALALPGRALVAVDLNGDRWPDLASDRGVLLNQGDGTFAPPELVFQSGTSVTAGDFDGDGDQDIALTPRGDILVFSNSGDGRNFVQSVAPSPDAFLVVAADIDADGRSELAVSNADDESVTILGFTTDWARVRSIPHPGLPGEIDVGDLDGDGSGDILSVSSFSSNGVAGLSVARGGGAQGLQEFLFEQHARSVIAGDLDGDGAKDVIVRTDEGLRIFTNRGDGTLGEPSVALPAVAGDLTVADVNADGKLDVVSVGGDLVVYLGDGEGLLGPPLFLLGGASDRGAAADFDGDGLVDLAVMSADRASIRVLINAGPQASCATP